MDGTAPFVLLTKAEIIQRSKLSDSTIDRLEKAGNFPIRLKLADKSTRYVESEFIEWCLRDRGGKCRAPRAPSNIDPVTGKHKRARLD
jgi:predicted DNA-binding transcriptional regulator AlpA